MRGTTDGASENTGVRGGMWAKLEGETELSSGVLAIALALPSKQ